MSNDQKNYQMALRLQKEGNYKEAIATAYQITHPALRAGILIDSGTCAEKTKIVREGVELFETIFKNDRGKISQASLLYNIGNGYSSIYQLRLYKGGQVTGPNDDDLRKAKKAYRDTLTEIKGNPPGLRSQILVNYGNYLSMLGRGFEAIQAFNQALILEPRNGMAAGNLGIELNRAGRITGL